MQIACKFRIIMKTSRGFTLVVCSRCLASKYFGFTWMLCAGRWTCESCLDVTDDEPLTLVENSSSSAIIWSVCEGNTPFQVPKRWRIPEWTAGSTCLYALQNTWKSKAKMTGNYSDNNGKSNHGETIHKFHKDRQFKVFPWSMVKSNWILHINNSKSSPEGLNSPAFIKHRKETEIKSNLG